MLAFRLIGLLIPLSLAGPLASPALAQSACNAPSRDEWLTSPPVGATEQVVPIAPFQLFQIPSPMVDEAIAMLVTAEFVPLDRSDLVRLIGDNGFPGVEMRLRPYLVRAVYPVANPQFLPAWRGNVLRIEAYGMGCAPFVKHPVVIYLDRVPARIEVRASADL